jgi:hypothetical protein
MKRVLYVLLAIAFALTLFGCKKDTRAEYHAPIDFVDLTPAPDCGYGSLVKPINLYPAHEMVVSDPNPTLMWDFEGCDIYSQTVNVSTVPDRLVGNVVHRDLLEDVRSYTVESGRLVDCTTYYWYVGAWGSADYYSDMAIFRTDFTGSCPPREPCTGAPPLPIPISPPGLSFSISTPQLLWMDSEPGCDVENYHYEVSTSPDFSEMVLEGDTSSHSVEFEDPYIFNDCSSYFWRVTAEANGYTRRSNIKQFGQMLTGSCEYHLCTAEQLVPPILLLPEEGSIITDPTPQFVWNYDFSICLPHHFNLEVSSTPDFAHVLWHTNYHENVSWIPQYEGNLSNCAKYYWRVTVRTEGEVGAVSSEIGTFYTDFGHTICGLIDRPDIPIEFVHDFGLGCVSGNQMWAIYDFLGPILGEYEVHVGNRIWPCSLMQGTNNELFCYGALAPAETELPVELFLKGLNEPVLTLEDTTPYCANVVVCQPPAEGCPRILVGYTQNQTPIYASTHWDQSQCQCVP